MKDNVFSKSETICWSCKRSGNTCPWLKNCTPVPGWLAERKDYRCQYMQSFGNVPRVGKYECIVDSYTVYFCPLYTEEYKVGI